MKNKKFVIKTILILSLIPSIGESAATRIAYIDAFATARGNAFTATADNASAVFYNSAGLSLIEGTEIHVNGYFFSAENTYDGFLGNAETDDDFQAIPSIFLAHNLKDFPISLGFGVYAPFALGVDWGEDAPFAPIGYEADLYYIKYHFAIAWQITEKLSVGIGPSYDNADIELKTTGPLGSFDGDDEAIGFSISILWQPSDKHSFGLNYQGPTTMDFKGNQTEAAPFAIPSKGKLDFPESIVVGYSWRPNEKWNAEFNLDWTNWDKVDDLTILNEFTSNTILLNWESAFIWEAGLTRYFDNGLNISGGYTYIENAVPDETFTPLVPDADRHFFSFGVGGDYKDFSWQLVYQFSYDSERTVADSPAPSTILTDGDYDIQSQSVAISGTYRF
ncbi:MAG: outer membrane protein transport protein [Verrucomicrobiota bacterium]